MLRKYRGRVLIADDDPVIRTILTSIVNNEGYEAVQVADGREAFQLLKGEANFVAALFDLCMPGLNGPDLLSHMKTEKRLQEIPVMLVTAETSVKAISDAFAAGVVAYLPKPFMRDQVRRAVRMLLHTNRTRAAA